MAEPTLAELQEDVEAARSRLSADLSVLRSPSTLAQFSDDVKQEAIKAKDDLLEKARGSAEATISGMVDELKARAAANPAACLLIGAGIAWRLLRHPPVATALVAAGAYGLMRATPGTAAGSDVDYLAVAKTRLREQAGELQAAVVSGTQVASDRLRDHATDLVQAAGAKAQLLSAAGREEAQQLAGQIADTVGSAVSDENFRDGLLLGIAGIAVAAALSLAYQRRRINGQST